jgi:hypothetical protein
MAMPAIMPISRITTLTHIINDPIIYRPFASRGGDLERSPF